MPQAKPPISRAGGKARLAKHILPLIAARPHTCYVEPFGGGGAILLAKPPSSIEVYNDIDSGLINAFRQIRNHPDELVRLLEFRVASREEHQAAQNRQPETELLAAADYLYRHWNKFGDDETSYGVRTKSGGSSSRSRQATLSALSALNQRLDKVNIEHRDWAQIFDTYDRPHTLFFCDPPYLGNDTAYKAWKLSDWVDFREALRDLKGQWIVTSSAHPEIHDLFHDCQKFPIVRSKGIENRPGKAKSPTYEELLITP
ncbi:DNA adenine methylase [Roseibacillus persicicus]|uniref:DNA adenine methylase n=1 Tax=Roseibacillus persicicus TaxID=454148 RepID=UPI00398AE48A